MPTVGAAGLDQQHTFDQPGRHRNLQGSQQLTFALLGTFP